MEGFILDVEHFPLAWQSVMKKGFTEIAI